MKPGERGWLKEYLDFRKELLRGLTEGTHKGRHPEHSLYQVLQPTGLMFGQSVESIDHPDSKNWGEKERMKVLLAESLISSSLLFHEKPIKSAEELSEVILRTLENIGNFYNNIFPELSTPTKTLFGRRKTALELAERILDKRIDHSIESTSNFWSQFFHNSLLFLDIFIFGQWVHTNADRIVSDFFKYERDELRFSVIKVIAAAAHANRTIEFEERKLFEYFLSSSGLTPENRKEAFLIFEKGIDIDMINLPTNNSWILKKYFLEMAILTIWSDKLVEDTELRFLHRLCEYMGFSVDDMENSMIAIEGFVLEHWEELNKLQNKQDYNQVSAQFIARMSRIAERNKNKLIREVQERADLMEMLRKARSNELTEREKTHLRDMLIFVLKTIPTLVIISLPQHFLTLPILMKILPSDFFAESLEAS